MKTILVTGGAGFIGSNYILYMLAQHPELRIVNLDKLTYAGNLENLREIEGSERHIFIQGDIRDTALVSELFEQYNLRAVVNFAAESHVDRSIENPGIFAETNILGTLNLLG
ncbi:MAG: GDP-mannose 4,6-dehydratase, partial [Oscillospiraceae bacterium]